MSRVGPQKALAQAYEAMERQRQFLLRSEPDERPEPVPEVIPDPVGDRARAYRTQLDEEWKAREQRDLDGQRDDIFKWLKADATERMIFEKTPAAKLPAAITEFRKKL